MMLYYILNGIKPIIIAKSITTTYAFTLSYLCSHFIPGIQHIGIIFKREFIGIKLIKKTITTPITPIITAAIKAIIYQLYF